MKIYVPSHSSRFQEYSHKYHLISGMKKAPGISARCFLFIFSLVVRWFVAKPMITRIWGCVINFFPPDFTGDSLRKSIAIRAASHIIPWIYNIMFATHAFAHREHLQDLLSYKELYYFVRIFASHSTIFGCYCICYKLRTCMPWEQGFSPKTRLQ